MEDGPGMSTRQIDGRAKKKSGRAGQRASGDANLLSPTHGTAFFVYIAGADPQGELTVGATGNLAGLAPLSIYWLERLDDTPAARSLAARIETWPHAWRIQMIARTNPNWRNLAETA